MLPRISVFNKLLSFSHSSFKYKSFDTLKELLVPNLKNIKSRYKKI